MPHSITLDSHGQITLPLEIREHFGLKEGDRVELVIEGDHLRIQPALREDDPFQRYIGVLARLPENVSVNDWLHDLRNDNGQR